MAPATFIALIFFTAGASCTKVCSYQDIVDHLNLTSANGAFTLTRPVLDHTHPTIVQLDILLYAILAVMEKTQTFIPFIWATMTWNNERIWWDPAEFCGITTISFPKDLLWKPDLFIYEMVQKDDSPQNPYVLVAHDGKITSEQDIKVVSTCKMDVHKFPFDTQECNISIGSSVHCVEELLVIPNSNSTRATQFSREVMKSQGEWEFLHLSVTSYNFSFDDRQWGQLIYTFTMKRRPLLHIINFVVPILFFLSLDLASFFISDHRGEKLGFKVTVLLAISVLLLILNDILPSTSNRTPLIASYCIVIFALMLLSLLETILVTYLMERESASQERPTPSAGGGEGGGGGGGAAEEPEADKPGDAGTDGRRRAACWCISGEKQHRPLPDAEEVAHGVRPGEFHVLLLILEEMRELQESLRLQLGSREPGRRFVVWATRINRAFFIFYVTVVALFLTFIFREWNR